MKKLGFLLSMLAFAIIAQHTQTVAAPPPPPPGCANVTVTYVGGMPYSSNHVDAYQLTPCGSTRIDDHYIFKAPEDTVTLKQGTNLWISPSNRPFGYDIKSTVTGSQINIECSCTKSGACKDCKYRTVAPQKSKSL